MPADVAESWEMVAKDGVLIGAKNSSAARERPEGARDDDVFHRIARVAPTQAEPQTRFASLVENQVSKPSSWDGDSRTFTAILTTAAPVRRWFGTEILRIDADAIDLERVSGGQARLLDSHNAGELGAKLGVIERVWIEGDALVGTIRVDNTEAGNNAIPHIRDGIGVSIGYRVNKWQITEVDEETGRETWTGTKWELFEASLVSVPADRKAMVRSIDPASGHKPPTPAAQAIHTGALDMPLNDDAGTRGVTEPTSPPPAAPAVDEAAVRKSAIAEERARIAEINLLAASARLPELAAQSVKDGSTVQQFRDILLEHMIKKQGEPIKPLPSIEVTRDEGDTRRSAMIDAQLFRARAAGVTKPTEASREGGYLNLRLVDVARRCLEAAGDSCRNLPEHEVVTRALHTTSDFPNVLAGVANQSLRSAYDTAPETFRSWTREISLTDFRAMNMLQLDGGGSLRKVNEHGEFKRGTLAESKEAVSLSTFGEVIGVTRQAIINDNLGALTRIPTILGRRAASTEGDTVYRIILANAAMGDGVTLFYATTHVNLGTTAAFTATQLGLGRLAMSKQTGLDGKSSLNIVPQYLLIPPDLEVKAAQELGVFTPTVSTNVVPDFIRSLQFISEPRLSIGIPKSDGYAAVSGSATAYYLSANPSSIDTIVYAYLNGQSGPYTEERVGFDVDGIEMKIRHDFGAAAVEFRGLWKNIGA